MKKSLITIISTITLTIIMLFSSACTISSSNTKIQEFYDAVVESQECLDEVGDTIYDYWYNAIYKNSYSGNINLAIAYAKVDCKTSLDFIETNDAVISTLYKTVRDSDLKDEVKEVMNAYSEYYEFVVNVSGSFNSYSKDKEVLKKALATALKNLSLEM